MLEPIRQLRLTTLESAPGGFSADVARALTDLGILNNHLGKASEAESFYSRAIGISRKVPLFQNEDLATGFINLAELLSRQGKIQESLALYQEIIKDLRSIVGPPGPYLALALHNLGVTLCNERDHVRDLPNLQEAVSIWEKLRLEARLAQGLHDLGVALCWREQFQEAEKCFNRSIGITIERLGTRSIALVPLYGSLGVCYCRRGDYLPADDAFFMAKHIASGVPVEAEPSGVEGVDLQAAICLSNQGRYAEAEEKLRDVLRESPEPQTPAQLENRADVLRLLGAVCSAQGKFTPAERFHKMSQGILEKLCGNKSPRLVENLQNLSRIYTSMRRDKEARESNERILRIREASNSDESGVARCTD
jgi:tetratricopeptide (TPR) repeat protein